MKRSIGLMLWVACLPLTSISCSPATPAVSAVAMPVPSMAEAQDLRAHGLIDQAIEKSIEVLYHPSTSENDRAEALFLMGQVAFDRNQAQLAMEDWKRLADQYPRSERAAEVNQRMARIYQVAKARSAQQ